MTIEFARGDSYAVGFQLREKDSGTAIDSEFDEIYFTVKRAYTDKEYKFQKTLTGGGIVSDGNGHYTLNFLPEDTATMAFGRYDVDLEFDRGENFVKTFAGELNLTKETTHSTNKG